MKESDNKDVSNRAYRLLVPYSNTVDMAKKILLFYNGYLMASGNEKNVIDARHLNLDIRMRRRRSFLIVSVPIFNMYRFWIRR